MGQSPRWSKKKKLERKKKLTPIPLTGTVFWEITGCEPGPCGCLRFPIDPLVIFIIRMGLRRETGVFCWWPWLGSFEGGNIPAHIGSVDCSTAFVKTQSDSEDNRKGLRSRKDVASSIRFTSDVSNFFSPPTNTHMEQNTNGSPLIPLSLSLIFSMHSIVLSSKEFVSSPSSTESSWF